MRAKNARENGGQGGFVRGVQRQVGEVGLGERLRRQGRGGVGGREEGEGRGWGRGGGVRG